MLAPEELRGGHPLLRVLDADAEDLFRLLDLAQVHARALPPGGHLGAGRFPQDPGPLLRWRRLGQRPI